MTGRILRIIKKENVHEDAEWESVYKQNPSSVLTVKKFRKLASGKTHQYNEVLATNSKYTFKLSRKSEESEWLLASFDMDNKKILSQRRVPLADLVLEELAPHFAFTTLMFQSPVAEMLKKPDFVKKVSEVDRAGQKLIKLDFTHSQTVRGETEVALAWILLDPDHYWFVVEYAVQFKLAKLESGSEVVFGERGIPIIKRYTMKSSFCEPPDKPIGFRELVYNYDLHEAAEVPEQEFTLSAFGLPEPAGVVWTRTPPYYLWFAIATAAAFALAIAFRYLAKRRAKAQTVS
jgi:hypothetical protein